MEINHCRESSFWEYILHIPILGMQVHTYTYTAFLTVRLEITSLNLT